MAIKNPDLKMERRKFIQYTVAGFITASLPLSVQSQNLTLPEAAIADPNLLSFIENKEEVLTVGKIYRYHFPDEDNKRTLKTTLIKRNQDLEQLVEKDFELGNTVIINGWVLSITEARQCALYSIIHSEKPI